MKQICTCLTTVALLHILGPLANADLPELKEKPYLGYFVAWEDRNYRFAITSEALGQLFPKDRSGNVKGVANPIKIDFRVLETQPDGTMARKELDKDSLSTSQKAEVDGKEPVTFSGKAAGEAGFETTISPMRGGFTISGKITEKGALTNPTRFGVDLSFDPYRHVDLDTEEQREKFEKMSKKDELEIVTIKGEKKKFDIDEQVNLGEMFSEGASQVTIESARYEDMEIELVASEGSKILFEDDSSSPVYESLKFVWVMNEGANPAKENLTLIAK